MGRSWLLVCRWVGWLVSDAVGRGGGDKGGRGREELVLECKESHSVGVFKST